MRRGCGTDVAPRFRRRAIGDDDDLSSLRAALHDHLQITCKAEMGAVRIRGHSRIHESAAHDIRHMVDERVMNAAIRYMNHAVGARFKQPEFGCS